MSSEADMSRPFDPDSRLTDDDFIKIQYERRALSRARVFTIKVGEIGAKLVSSNITFHVDTSSLEVAWGSDAAPDTFILCIRATCPEIFEKKDTKEYQKKIHTRKKISELLSSLVLLLDGDKFYQDNRIHGVDNFSLFYNAEFSNREIPDRKYGKLQKKVDKLVRKLQLD